MFDSNNKTKRVLVELDALQDTRLGAIMTTNTNIDPKDIIGDKYLNREEDDFSKINPMINNDLVKQCYKNRDIAVLSNSVPTKIIEYLIDLTQMYDEEKKVQAEFIDGVIVVVNVFPYKLEAIHLKEMMRILNHRLGDKVKVKFVDLSPSETNTKSLVEMGYQQYIMYNYHEWLSANIENVESFEELYKAPKFVLVVPGIRAVNPSDELLQELDNSEYDYKNAFDMSKLFFSALFTLTFLPISAFSIRKV